MNDELSICVHPTRMLFSECMDCGDTEIVPVEDMARALADRFSGMRWADLSEFARESWVEEARDIMREVER